MSRRTKTRDDPLSIIHPDVNGKALALLLIMTIAVFTVHLAQSVSPARDTRDTAVNTRAHEVSRDDVSLDTMRDAGLIMGYRVPPGRLAFAGEGGSIFLPLSPTVDGPREPRVIRHGNRSLPRVALTFDTTEMLEPESLAIIETLTALRAPATFFVCGGWCYANPELLRMAIEVGFEIANHSYSHPWFTHLSDGEIQWQIRSTEKAVLEVGGVPISAYFRPPFGDLDARVEQVVGRLGYEIILWSRDTADWHPATTQAQLRDRATVGIQGGDIILMHTDGKHTSGALPEIVNNLRADGFELTTVSGVLQP